MKYTNLVRNKCFSADSNMKKKPTPDASYIILILLYYFYFIFNTKDPITCASQRFCSIAPGKIQSVGTTHSHVHKTPIRRTRAGAHETSNISKYQKIVFVTDQFQVSISPTRPIDFNFLFRWKYSPCVCFSKFNFPSEFSCGQLHFRGKPGRKKNTTLQLNFYIRSNDKWCREQKQRDK